MERGVRWIRRARGRVGALLLQTHARRDEQLDSVLLALAARVFEHADAPLHTPRPSALRAAWCSGAGYRATGADVGAVHDQLGGDVGASIEARPNQGCVATLRTHHNVNVRRISQAHEVCTGRGSDSQKATARYCAWPVDWSAHMRTARAHARKQNEREMRSLRSCAT